jgi:hypothetical protein
MGWQNGILGYRPSIGELIVALILAILAERVWRLGSRAWDFVLDRFASLFYNLRIRRIRTLELKIKQLDAYDDRKALFRFLRKIVGFILIVGLAMVMNILVLSQELRLHIRRITDFLNIPDLAVFGYNLSEPDVYYEEMEYFFVYTASLAMLILLFWLGASTAREINDFADPPKAIKRLEARISALRAKDA